MTKQFKTLVKTVAGSRLFGCSVPSSDEDFKFMFLPHGKDILLERAPVNIQDKAVVDCEGFSLSRFLSMCAKGQTLALEMLFTPPVLTVETSDVWQEILRNRWRLVSREISPFVGYTRAQSSKYCVKAERYKAAEAAMRFFDIACAHMGTGAHVNEVLADLTELSAKHEHMEFVSWRDVAYEMFSCCGRMVPLTASVKTAHEIYREVFDAYGKRTQVAANMEHKDWKALYHAYRVACEANELLTTGVLTLPRPEADVLLKIRLGELSYEAVSDLIEGAAQDVERNLLTTELRETADWDWIHEFVLAHHGAAVKEWWLGLEKEGTTTIHNCLKKEHSASLISLRVSERESPRIHSWDESDSLLS